MHKYKQQPKRKPTKIKTYELGKFSFMVSRVSFRHNNKQAQSNVAIVANYDGKRFAIITSGEEFGYLNLAGHSGQYVAYAKRLAHRAIYYNSEGRPGQYQLLGKGWKVILDKK
jgi:hypothetical protein